MHFKVNKKCFMFFSNCYRMLAWFVLQLIYWLSTAQLFPFSWGSETKKKLATALKNLSCTNKSSQPNGYCELSRTVTKNYPDRCKSNGNKIIDTKKFIAMAGFCNDTFLRSCFIWNCVFVRHFAPYKIVWF